MEKKNFDEKKQPVVTILWSEHRLLQKGDQFTIYQADELFERFDSMQQEDRKKEDYNGLWYYKTKFVIKYMFCGKIQTYTGRQDFGDGDGGLIKHIKAHATESLNCKDLVTNDEIRDSLKFVLNEFISYLELHKGLTDIELSSKKELAILKRKKLQGTYIDNLDSKITFSEDVLKYVEDNRKLLNFSEENYNFSKMPQMKDYLLNEKVLEEYKYLAK